MVQRWMEWSRRRHEDRARALRAAEEASRCAFREALAEYDSFVPLARGVEQGLFLGAAASSAGDAVPIRLPRGDEYVHWVVQGGTGTGKTTWIASLLRQELEAGRPFGVIDCKGDLWQAAIRWIAATCTTMPSAERRALRQRLIVLNPFGDDLVPLNVCRPLPGSTAEVQAYEVTLALSRLFDTALGLHMENILRHLLILLIEAGLSLVEAPEILQDELLRGILASRSTNPAVKEFFLRAWPAIPQASKDALLARLHSLLLSENLRLMLGAEGLIDLRGILERGDPLVVFLGKGPGIPEEQVEILGSLFLQLLLQATYARGSGSSRPYLIAVDEFFHLLEAPALTRRFGTALTTVRSFGLSLCLIHHNFAQLPTSLREIILGNCDLVSVFRTSARNAEFFGDFLPEVEPELLARTRDLRKPTLPRDLVRRHQLETLQRLPDRQCYWYDRRKPHRAIRLRVPDLPEPNEVAGLKPADFEALIEREGWRRGGAAVPRTQLRAEIEARKERLRELIRPPIRVRDRQDPDLQAPGPQPKEGQSTNTNARKRRPRLG